MQSILYSTIWPTVLYCHVEINVKNFEKFTVLGTETTPTKRQSFCKRYHVVLMNLLGKSRGVISPGLFRFLNKKRLFLFAISFFPSIFLFRKLDGIVEPPLKTLPLLFLVTFASETKKHKVTCPVLVLPCFTLG